MSPALVTTNVILAALAVSADLDVFAWSTLSS